MTKLELAQVFHTDPEIMGGTPVFTGTRVPVQNLVDYLEGGESIGDFLAGFPSVKHEQVIGFIELDCNAFPPGSVAHRATPRVPSTPMTLPPARPVVDTPEAP